MSKIDPHNHMRFRSAKDVYAKVNRTLRSFKNNALIDEGEYPQWTSEVLKQLGVGTYQEAATFLEINDFKAKLPDNYSVFYSGHRYRHNGTDFSHKPVQRFQYGFVWYTNKTEETYLRSGNCELRQEGKCLGDGVYEKMTYTECLSDGTFGRNGGSNNGSAANYHHYDHCGYLRLSPNVKKNKCNEKDTPFGNHHHHRHEEAMIEDGYIYTNFEHGHVFLKYYAFPLDLETNTPLIPDVNSIELAIEKYITWQLFLSWYWNDEVPNVMQKAREAERLYTEAFKQALYEIKLPSFQSMIDAARIQRHSMGVYRSLDRFGSWQ